ncbi:matrilin-2-like [Haliotis rufescens]|uniref:matrilin-2-like n=1 Tax=Haliotis rufescens TaxID=6454 RepID=UPI00201EDDCA|nr:matrilin-2-like [Haliotis rufescens]
MTARFLPLLVVLSVYSAAQAQAHYAPCSSNPCANGGTCTDKTPFSFICKCAPGFSGGHCKGAADKCFNTPCKNGGICKNNPNGHTCTCLLGYEGANCGKKCLQKKLDILLIEDISSSISPDAYRQIKDFEMELLSYARIKKTLINVAFLVYSGKAQVNFLLNSHPNNKRAAINAVNAQKQKGGSTFLGDAINMAVSDVFVEENGDRPDADNIVILFTDGKSSKKSTISRNIGRLLTEAIVFVVPTSSDLDLEDISEVASSPDEEHIFSLSNPLALDEIKERTIYMKCGVNVALRE